MSPAFERLHVKLKVRKPKQRFFLQQYQNTIQTCKCVLIQEYFTDNKETIFFSRAIFIIRIFGYLIFLSVVSHLRIFYYFIFMIRIQISLILLYNITIQTFSQMANRSNIQFCVFFLLLMLIYSHVIKEVPTEQKQIVGAYVNQPVKLAIPFQKCFKVQTQFDANKEYIDFKPTRITVSSQKSYSLKSQGSKISVFQELRSPISYKHRHLLVFQGYLMVFFAPNVIIIVEQTSNGFAVKRRYHLQNLDRFDQFKMYKLGGKGLLVIYNKKIVYLLNQLDYQDYTLPDISNIVHLQELNSWEFFAAEFMKGLTHYKLNEKSKTIEIVKKYTGSNIGLSTSLNYVVDLNLNFYEKEKIIYILDAQAGLLQLNLNKNLAKIIVNHVMCESFDTIQQNHIVMLCQNQGHSSIIEIYRQEKKVGKAYVYHKVQPIFQQSYLNDLHVTDSFFLAYSYKSLKVFWNTQKNRLPQTLETQSQIVLPGLETFTLIRNKSQNYLYTVEAGQLYKYRLIEQPASLQVKSPEIITKTFKLFLYGSCADLQQNKDRIQACKVSKLVQMKISQEQYPRQEDLGISASIVAILVIVFLLVIWICLKKYKGLERQARKVLQAYQNKRLRQNRRL